MNVDKGMQTSSGENALAIGDIANTVPCGETPQWRLKQLSSGSDSIEVTSDQRGTVWLFSGTDSGFESKTSVYFTQLTTTFEPI